jgi:CDP-diacylglycerol--serine O-phosphatidyltransferase
MKKHIPNFITCLNLVCGCLAVFFGFKAIMSGNFSLPLYFILAAAVFDFLDGMAARVLNARSEMGKQLDSLADMISFGLAPGALVVAIIGHATNVPDWLPFVGFVIPVFSALRLAKFNIDERQTSSFLGLAVPANALFFGGLAYSYSDFFSQQPYLLIAIAIVFCVLLVSEIPMFSLKFKNLKLKDNCTQFIFIVGCVLLVIFLKFNAFASIIVWYILLSIINTIIKRKP